MPAAFSISVIGATDALALQSPRFRHRLHFCGRWPETGTELATQTAIKGMR